MKILKIIKNYILVFILAFLALVFLLFPFGDIGDLVSAQISKATRNQVQVQFDDINLHLLPPGIQLSQVQIKTSMAPELKVEKLSLSPSVLALFNKKPLGSLSAQNFLGGNIDLSSHQAKPTEQAKERFRFEVEAEQINMSDLKKILQLPLDIEGQLELSGMTELDFALVESPNAQYKLKLSNLQLSSISIPTPLGPLGLPSIAFKQILSSGKYSNGQIQFENLEFGDAQDELQGTLKGTVGLSLQMMNSRLMTRFGSYSLELQLNAKQSFISKMSTIVDIMNSLIPESARKQSSSGIAYRLKLTGERFGPPPRIEALR